MSGDPALEKEVLQFTVFSSGSVSIDLRRCPSCASKACIKVCLAQGGPLVLDAERGVPALKMTPAEIQRGGCVECLGCELDCSLHGLNALTIDLPMAGFEDYLDTHTERLVYRR